VFVLVFGGVILFGLTTPKALGVGGENADVCVIEHTSIGRSSFIEGGSGLDLTLLSSMMYVTVINVIRMQM